MSARWTVRTVAPTEVEDLRELRLRSLREEPTAFLLTEEEERASRSLEDYERQAERWGGDEGIGVVGAWLGDELVGLCGWYRQERSKVRHRVEVWGLYVTPEARGRGASRKLLEEVLRRVVRVPGVTHVQLGVSAGNAPARRLYEKLGFEAWGTEPAAMVVDGRPVDLVSMARRVGDAP